jgi:hypothetical protein
MTNEQLDQLKAMDHQTRFRKYTPMLISGKITEEAYDAVFTIPYVGNGDFRLGSSRPVQDGGEAPDNGGAEPHMGSSGPDTGVESDQVVGLLLKEFGGREITGSTTSPNPVKGKSQKARLHKLLSDGEWHSTDEIQKVVYGGDHMGLARVAARVFDLKKDGYLIQSCKLAGTIWEYKMTTGSE